MLQVVGQHVTRSHMDSQHLEVHLPGGEIIEAPFFSSFNGEPLFYTEQNTSLKFDVVLWVQVDEDEWEMFREDDWELDEQGMVRFGCLDLTIDFRPEKASRFVSFRFHAVTDGMSDLMEHSRSLRREFGKLLSEGGGICGILELDGYREDEAMLWWLKGQEMVQWFSVPGKGEVDENDRWFCRQFDGLVERWLQE